VNNGGSGLVVGYLSQGFGFHLLTAEDEGSWEIPGVVVVVGGGVIHLHSMLTL